MKAFNLHRKSDTLIIKDSHKRAYLAPRRLGDWGNELDLPPRRSEDRRNELDLPPRRPGDRGNELDLAPRQPLNRKQMPRLPLPPLFTIRNESQTMPPREWARPRAGT